MAEPPIPKLLVPEAEAREKIKTQMKTGIEIVESLRKSSAGFGVATNPALEKAKAAREKWAKFTIDLLKTLVDDLPIHKEFGSPEAFFFGANQDQQLMEWMTERLHRLDSILDRLAIFPSVEKPVQAKAAPAQAKKQSMDIFIVHGHDNEAKEAVARFLEKLGLRAIILHEQADKGRTIIEKFEAHSNVGFAVILLTPDDIGFPREMRTDAKPRSRQNVVFELGFFIGKLGRDRVCALRKGDIETPTDYLGVLYKTMDGKGAWKLELAKEIKHAGIDVDLNKAL
jgi:predicted nucleotide-binding protein